METPKFAVSPMCIDFSIAGEQVSTLSQHTDSLHLDIMDGRFVPNLSLNPEWLKWVLPHSSVRNEAHLMTADSGFGTIQQASTLLSVMTIGGMLMGFAFGFINKALQAQTLTVGLAALAAGSLVIYFAPNFVVLCAGAMIAGISYPTMISYTFNQISEVCPKGSDTLCTSVVLVGCNLGAFTAPYTLKLVGGSALSQPYLVYGIVLLVIAAAYAAYHLIRK